MSSCWIRIILGAYINPLGMAFLSRVKNSREILFSTIDSCERDLLVTFIFSSLYSIKISPLLPVDVGTLLNHVKSCVSWLCGDCLLVVDLSFRFRCRVFDFVFLCCLIGDKSSTNGIRAMPRT